MNGSATAEALLKAGHDVTVYDSLVTGHRAAVPEGASFIQADLSDSHALAEGLTQRSFDAVMHFAAASLVGESVSDPQKYYLNNVAGTICLLQAMREADCMKLVFSSTGAVYGNAGSEPIRK